MVADKFVPICKERATLFNNFCVAQCQPFQHTSKLPEPNPLTRAKLDISEITSKQISNILTGLKINKAHGPDDISVNMIKLIFDNILRTTKFPKQTKIANDTPVHKKENK